MNQEALGKMAGEIAGLLRRRTGLSENAGLTTNVGTVATGNGARVQVCISDLAGNALLSVSVELCTPQKSPPQLNLVNRVRN